MEKTILYMKNNLIFLGNVESLSGKSVIKEYNPISYINKNNIKNDRFYIVLVDENKKIFSLDEIFLVDESGERICTETIDDNTLLLSSNDQLNNWKEKTKYH